MDTKTIAIIIVFAALTIALNLSPIKFPAPYMPFLIYQIWEIPMVMAFLLYGKKVGILIALINTGMLIAVFPGALPTGPLYNLVAVLSMLFGVGVMKFFMEKRSSRNDILLAGSFTVSGIIFRTAIMALMNYVLLRFPPPVGYDMPEGAIIATIPLVAFFNFTLALYTIPTGYLLAKIVDLRVKILK